MYSGKAGTRVRLGLAVAGADEVEVVIDNPSDFEKGQQHLPWLARSGTGGLHGPRVHQEVAYAPMCASMIRTIYPGEHGLC